MDASDFGKSKGNLEKRKLAASSLKHLPGRRQAHLDELHSIDMGEVRFCDLGTFGRNLASREVRNRAIADRVNFIGNSSSNY